jgi:hypothetical protein
LFSRFKAELLQNGAFLTIEDAKTKIFEYIELYYNRIRRHSALGYESPNLFEEKYYKHSTSLASRGAPKSGHLNLLIEFVILFKGLYSHVSFQSRNPS